MTIDGSGRCMRCGTPIIPGEVFSAADNPFARAVERYIELYRDATRRSTEWRHRATALEQRGDIANAAYLGLVCDGVWVQTPQGNLSEVRIHYEARLAAASDADRRSIIDQRDEALARATEIYRRWQKAAVETGADAAAQHSAEAWASVDAVDLDALWSAQLSGRNDIMAMLRLIREVGWEGMEPADCAPQRAAVAAVIADLECLQ
jgi:hypothetical protein